MMKHDYSSTTESKELFLANEELKKTKAELIKTGRLYAFISQINQKIVRINDEETLFHNACEMALEFGKFKMAWIGIFKKENKTISLVHQCGIPKEDIKLFTETGYKKNDPQDYVLRTGKHFICNDIENDLELQNWKPYAAKNTIQSCIVLPIKKAGEIIGTFNLYSTELNFSSEEDLKLLLEMTGDISFALDFFEREKRHKELMEERVVSQKKIEESEARYRAFFENSIDGIVLTVADGKILSANPAACEMFRMTEQEICEMGRFGMVDLSDPRANTLIKERQMTGSAKGELTFLRKDGSKFAGEISSVLFLDSNGEKKTTMIIRDITERKEAEKQKEFDKNNMNALINNTKDLMWSVDREYNLIESNLPFDESVKLTLGRTISKGSSVLFDGLSKKYLEKYKVIYDRAFSGETFSEFEQGDVPTENWVEISYYPMLDKDKIIGVACHSKDITEIKITERQLQKSEAFNSGVLNTLSSHIAVLDSNGEILAVNESWKKFALENGETSLNRLGVGNNYFKVCEKSTKDGDLSGTVALDGIKAVRDGKQKDFYFEYPCHSPEKKRWFGMRVMKFDGEEQMIVVTHQNITERRSAEKKLLLSENRLKEAQAIAHIGNWEIDLNSSIQVWSDEMYSIFGMNKEEGEPTAEILLSFILNKDRERVVQEVKEAVATLKSDSSEFHFKTKENKEKYGYIEWKFQFDLNNRPIRLYGILKDNTETKLAEMEREKMITEIIQHSKNLEQFAHIISHNLRGPVVNILGLSNVLNGEVSDADRIRIQQYLFNAVGQLDEVVTDLNKILQTKSDMTETKENILLSQLVDDIQSSIRSLIEKEKVQVLVDFSAIDQVNTVKSYLHSIFYNLITNSIKYRYNGRSPVIQITSSIENARIKISFKDNGSGIDLNVQGEKIFGLYKRFHENIEGKGFGLFMVKTQVETLGGKIGVKSEPKVGTEFIIELPI